METVKLFIVGAVLGLCIGLAVGVGIVYDPADEFETSTPDVVEEVVVNCWSGNGTLLLTDTYPFPDNMLGSDDGSIYVYTRDMGDNAIRYYQGSCVGKVEEKGGEQSALEFPGTACLKDQGSELCSPQPKGN